MEAPMSLSCLLHGHKIIRYDRELAWECIRCLKKWPMAKELVSPSGNSSIAEELPSSDDEGTWRCAPWGWCELPKHRYWSGFSMTFRSTPQQPLAADSPPYPRRGALSPRFATETRLDMTT